MPALLHKDKLLELFAKEMYTDNYFLYMGYAHGHSLPTIDDADNKYQYAVVNSENNVIGYLSYRVCGDSVINFGLYSFDKGNPVIGRDLFEELERLVSHYHRVEWCMVSGNPVKKHYDRYCKYHGGNMVVLHDNVRDNYGNYHDTYIYEIVNKEK